MILWKKKFWNKKKASSVALISYIYFNKAAVNSMVIDNVIQFMQALISWLIVSKSNFNRIVLKVNA